MQASRLLSILLLLQSKGRISARELADTFEVSVRTIYRDADELSAAGVPIYAERGRHGGFQLIDGYRTHLTGLDRDEAETLFLSGLPGVAEQLGLGLSMARTRLKLLAALPEQARANAQRIEARFYFDPVNWFQGQDDQPFLPELALAVWNQNIIRMTYDSWKGIVVREALPLGVVLKAGAWYFVAEVSASVRTYKVASIRTLSTLEETPVIPNGFSLENYWKTFCRDYENRILSNFATIRANAQGLKGLCRLGDAARRAVETSAPEDAHGFRTVILPLDSVDGAVGDLLRLGPNVEVMAPVAMRIAMLKSLEAISNLYRRDPLHDLQMDLPLTITSPA
jgi:predicted DNA-binding transcriptional regulator YafY